jgi:signal transduction histidine kinase
MWLKLELRESVVRLAVEDNGQGFNPGAAGGAGGNGLANMQARLAECGGRAEITSRAGQGTRILFQFPLRR